MITLDQHLQKNAVSPSVCDLILQITNCCKDIAWRVRQGAIAGILGASESENVQGETQKHLDIISNQLLKDALFSCNSVAALASEEEDYIVPVNKTGDWLVAFDPLDGSSNIDINGQIGTIVSILPARKDLAIDDEAQFQQQGINQVAALYVLYGPSTLLAITTGKGTDIFTLDIVESSFVLTHPNMRIAADTKEFSINMSNQLFWSEKMQAYIQQLVMGEAGPRKRNFNMRWNGAMVGDMHRVIMRGGIFLYPSDSRNPKQPAKLRLLYEANPMAMLIENAGGKAFTEQQRILEINPSALHQRVAVIMGSANEVDVCVDL